MDNLLAHYYVKPSRARYILYKCPHKNMSTSSQKTNYVDSTSYEVGSHYITDNLQLICLEPAYFGIE